MIIENGKVIFDTEAEADAQQAIDYANLVAYYVSIGASQKAIDATTAWAVPVLNEDGKWEYPRHPRTRYEGTLGNEANMRKKK